MKLGWRWSAIAAVGLYVPGGSASYPSSVLMNAIPAKVAGVDRVVMVVPTPRGQILPLVLAAARLAGVDEIYRVGGARPWQRWPMAPIPSSRCRRLSVRGMPMSLRPSGRFSGRSEST